MGEGAHFPPFLLCGYYNEIVIDWSAPVEVKVENYECITSLEMHGPYAACSHLGSTLVLRRIQLAHPASVQIQDSE